MPNLTPEQESINRIHLEHQVKNIRTDPECKECQRIQHMPPYRTQAQRIADKHAELAKEVADLNEKNGTNYVYSVERGIYQP